MMDINAKSGHLRMWFRDSDLYGRACRELWMARGVDGEGGYLEPAFYQHVLQQILAGEMIKSGY